jgi:phosphoribosylformylglycinamidine synthase
MIHFFETSKTVFAVQTQNEISAQDISKLNWLLPTTHILEKSVLTDFFVDLVPLWLHHGALTQ